MVECGGPLIPLRTGRRNALEAGSSVVPDVIDSLEEIREKFTHAGFPNLQDMIAMVACGHTLGGVHDANFPDITAREVEIANHVHFDRTFDAFDSAVAKEYLDGTTTSPLVVGLNETKNTDALLFAADGNATIRAMTEPSKFQDTCRDILARMIDTMPADVELSNPLIVPEVKPYVQAFSVGEDGELQLRGRIRIRTTDRDTGGLSVYLSFLDRAGRNLSKVYDHSNLVPTVRPTQQNGTSSGLVALKERFTWFEFDVKLKGKVGVSAFDIHLRDDKSGTMKSQIFNNGGLGFGLDDGLLLQQSESCLNASTDPEGDSRLSIVAAVREDLLR